MAHPSSSELNTASGRDDRPLEAPENPKAVDVQIGVRWAAVTWQPPRTTPDSPVEDYLLAISPGHQTIRFDGRTTQTVLIALAPHQPYTIFVAARNAAGSSGWVSSRPVQLDYTVEAPAQSNALINAELFEDLLLFNDGTLGDWLTDVDDVDLELAIMATPRALRERILACTYPPERAQVLRQKLAPPSLPAQIVRRSEVIQPQPSTSKPMMPRPDVVIEIPTVPRQRRNLWAVAVLPLLLVVFALIWLIQPIRPIREDADLKATVDSLVAVRLTPEVLPSNSPTPAPTAQPTLPVLVPASTLSTLAGTPSRDQALAVYAEPAVDLLNMRSGPGEVYDVQEILPAGTQVELQGRNEDGTWVYVASGNVEGWVASWLLTIVGDPDELTRRVPPPTPIPTPTTALLTVAQIPPTVQAPIQAANVQALTASTAIATVTQPSTSNSAVPLTTAADSTCLAAGHFWLIHPVEITVYDQVSFRWGFSAPLPEECGFEVSVWRVGGAPRGVHDAVADNKNGVVKLSHQNEYRLDVPFMHNLPSVTGTGDYFWTVSIVEIEPTYRSFNRTATPSRFYLDLPSR